MARHDDKPEDQEYVFHFKLEQPLTGAENGDALADLVGSQLRSLLDVIVLTRDGKDLDVDGFRFLESGSPVHPLFD